MDMSPLEDLKGRWPADQAILLSNLDALQNVSEHLQIDDHHSQTISQFAAANHFAYARRPVEPPVRTSGYTPAWIRVTLPLNEPAYVHELSGMIDGYAVVMYLEYVPTSTGQSNDRFKQKRSWPDKHIPKLYSKQPVNHS